MSTHELDELYATWMRAEITERASLLLHQAHSSAESLALYEQTVENTQACRDAYETAIRERTPASITS